MSQAFYFEELDNKIGVLYFDLQDEKVNKFSTPVMEELGKTMKDLSGRGDLRALLFMSRKEDAFIAGADVLEIKDLSDPENGYQVARKGQEIFDYFSRMPFPTISVINGACMGGGTELSLACSYRLVTDNPKTSIALPEVNLGILPGWGGCTRLPRLIGLQKSFDVILTGRKMNHKKAYRVGIADKIIAAEWALEKAVQFVEEILTGNAKKYLIRRKSKGLLPLIFEKNPFGRNILFSKARQLILKKSGGHYPAPLRALEVIKQSHGKSIEKSFEIEARALGDLVVTPISKNLVQIFLWTQEIKRENGTNNPDLKGVSINKSGVLGAGAMGGGIAQLFASKGIPIRVKDINNEALAGAYKQAGTVLKGQLKRRRINKYEYTQIMHRISGTTDYSGFGHAGIIIEAIVEDLEIKKKVLSELEKTCAQDAIIATNTSSLQVNDMADTLLHKERFAGMHFFNPVHRMPLVEIVRGRHTSDKTIATLFNLSKSLGKTPIVVNDAPGFLVNRLLVPYMVEAISLLEEGHTINDIDKSMLRFGMPMGPIALFDEVGIDVAHKAAKILRKFMGDRIAESTILEKLIEKGRLGKKSGKGFYRYSAKSKEADPLIPLIIDKKEHSELNKDEMNRRMVYPMINEAARCLDEGLVSRPRDVDIGMIFGTGFAPFRGGLLKYADSEGLDKVTDALESFAERFGSRFKPSDSLQIFARDRKGFYKT